MENNKNVANEGFLFKKIKRSHLLNSLAKLVWCKQIYKSSLECIEARIYSLSNS